MMTKKDFQLFAEVISRIENEVAREKQINFVIPILRASNHKFNESKFKEIEQYKGRKERKGLKEKLLKLKNNLEKQNKHLFNLFLKPNENSIKAINRFLLNPPYNSSKRHEQIGIKQLHYIISKAQEQKNKIKKLIVYSEKD